MKRTLKGIAAASIVLGMMAPAALASTVTSTVGGRKAIAVNGQIVSQPYTRVAKDGNVLTSYMGIWYLGQAIKAAGGDYSWDPVNKVFSITVPGVDPSKLNIPGGVGTGNSSIVINGKLVKKVNSFAAQDPAGPPSDITTFMPIFYLGEIFGQLGGSSWDGNTFSFQKFAPVPASVTLSTLTSLVADGQSTETVTAKVVDASGNPVSGVTVNFSSSNTSVATITPSATTDANGVAQATITAGTTVGSTTISATVNNITQSATLTTTQNLLKVSAASATLGAGNMSGDTVTATVYDSNGNPVPNAVVTFSVPSSTSAAFNTNGTLQSTQVITNSNGQASVTVYDNKAESVPVTVSYTPAGGSTVTRTTTIAFTAGTVANVTFTVSPTTVYANGGATVTLTATDANGNGVPGAQFALVQDAGYQAKVGGTVVPYTVTGDTVTATTDANGKATFVITNTSAQTIGFTAYQLVAGQAPQYAGRFTVTWSPVAGNSSIALAANQTSQTVNQNVTLTVTVLDSYGNPADLSSATVTLTPSYSSGHVTINGSQIASGGLGTPTSVSGNTATFTVSSDTAQNVTFVANVTGARNNASDPAGTFNVTSQPVTVTFTNATQTPSSLTVTEVDPAAISSSLNNGVSTPAAPYTGQTVALYAKVLDQNGNPIANKTVALYTTGAGSYSAKVGGTTVPNGLPANASAATVTATTNSNGVAVFNVTDTVAETVPFSFAVQNSNGTFSALGSSHSVTFHAAPAVLVAPEFQDAAALDGTLVNANPSGAFTNSTAGSTLYAVQGETVTASTYAYDAYGNPVTLGTSAFEIGYSINGGATNWDNTSTHYPTATPNEEQNFSLSAPSSLSASNQVVTQSVVAKAAGLNGTVSSPASSITWLYAAAPSANNYLAASNPVIVSHTSGVTINLGSGIQVPASGTNYYFFEVKEYQPGNTKVADIELAVPANASLGSTPSITITPAGAISTSITNATVSFVNGTSGFAPVAGEIYQVGEAPAVTAATTAPVAPTSFTSDGFVRAN